MTDPRFAGVEWKMTSLNCEIEDNLRRNGADLVGFADVSGLLAELTSGLPRAISIGVRLEPAVIRDIASGPTRRYFAEYQRANALLAQLCDLAARSLTGAGHQANPISATTERFDPVRLSTWVQHKTIATRAGVGWIGKSALLITRQYGPALRLSSVLTDADIEAGAPMNDSHCGDCRQCVDRCPAKAIVGSNWRLGLPRESIYDAPTCRATCTELSSRVGLKATICGICINACPWTQRYLARELKPLQASIDHVTAEDIPTLRELFREYEAELPFDLSFQNFEEELASLPGRYASPTGRLLLARCGGDPVGCVALRQIGHGLCEMKRLFVRPAFRRQGVGQALAEAVVEEARRIRYKRMRLDTVLEPAKGLYRSMGFRQIPPYQDVPIPGVVFMELEL